MRLKDILSPQDVIPDILSATRDDVISELVDKISDQAALPADKLVRLLIERENQAPTAMSGGVAVPHARLRELDRFILAVGRSGKGIKFGEGEEPTRIFFLLIAPAGDTVTHLKVLARIARICRSQSFLQDVRDAYSARDIYERIMKEDEQI